MVASHDSPRRPDRLDAEADRRAIATRGADGERPFVASPDAVGDAQANSDMTRLGAEERLNGAFQNLRRHPQPIITDVEDNPATRINRCR